MFKLRKLVVPMLSLLCVLSVTFVFLSENRGNDTLESDTPRSNSETVLHQSYLRQLDTVSRVTVGPKLQETLNILKSDSYRLVFTQDSSGFPLRGTIIKYKESTYVMLSTAFGKRGLITTKSNAYLINGITKYYHMGVSKEDKEDLSANHIIDMFNKFGAFVKSGVEQDGTEYELYENCTNDTKSTTYVSFKDGVCTGFVTTAGQTQISLTISSISSNLDSSDLDMLNMSNYKESSIDAYRYMNRLGEAAQQCIDSDKSKNKSKGGT